MEMATEVAAGMVGVATKTGAAHRSLSTKAQLRIGLTRARILHSDALFYCLLWLCEDMMLMLII